MNEVESTLKIAQGISEFGFMTIVCSIFLILSASLMIVSFKWFKGIIEQIIKDFSAQLETLQQTANRNGEAMVDIAEGLMPETQLRIKNTSGVYFDLATEKVCRMIKKIREENHIIDKEATKAKIRKLLTNLYNDRNSRFDFYRYRGKKLSEYCNPEWIEWVAKVIMLRSKHDLFILIISLNLCPRLHERTNISFTLSIFFLYCGLRLIVDTSK